MATRSESTDTDARVRELQTQVEDLKELVNTLLSVICEEPDGVSSGALLLWATKNELLHVIILDHSQWHHSSDWFC